MKHADILKKVEWKDLRRLTFIEMLIENTITLPWLFTSWLFAYFQYYFVALFFSAVFFLTALRQVHNGFHRSLGTGRFCTWFCLYINSILMMVSAHAVKFNHLRHHKYCMKEDDYEGKSARMPWYGAVLYGPLHIFHIHRITFQKGNIQYIRHMLAELLSIVVFVVVVVYFDIRFLVYHTVVMICGEFLTAFFAVWTVHHDVHGDQLFARTQRTGWKNRLTFNMFYHLEHHLFPAVPTIKLPELAKRIDNAFPELQKQNTF